MLKLLRSPATLIALLVGTAGLFLVLYAWQLPPFTSAIEFTDNAYVRGKVTIVSPQLAGYVTAVEVQDFEEVEAGQLLVQLDDRIFRQKLEQAKANLDVAKANLANSDEERLAAEARLRAASAQVEGAAAALATAEASWQRIAPLLERGVVTQNDADTARATLRQAEAAAAEARAGEDVARQEVSTIVVGRRSLEAAVDGSKAAVRLAEIDLQNTRITAPQDGRLGEVGARIGQYVAAGTQLVALVPERHWVVANFKETQLAGMRVGQAVDFTVDALQGAHFHGHIENFSPATGSEFSVLRPDNATGNFTKVAQRLPVRIQIDDGQPEAERLAPGMSVVVSVDTATNADGAEAR